MLRRFLLDLIGAVLFVSIPIVASMICGFIFMFL